MLFVIESLPRSGTHLLRTALSSHPNVLCLHEIFNNDVYDQLKRENGSSNPWPGDVPASEWLQAHEHLAEFVGVCVQPHHFQRAKDQKLGWESLRSMNLPTVDLYRHNILKQWVSKLQAQAVGRWETYEGETKPDVPPVTVNVGDFLRHFESVVGHRSLNYRERLIVSYEMLTQEYDLTMKGILDYLKIPFAVTKPSTVKVGKPLRDSIKNWEDVASTLIKMNMGWLLVE